MTASNKKAFWIIFFVVFLDLIGFGIVFPLLPLYMRDFHLSGTQIGLILGIYSLMQFIFAPILGRLSDRIGRRPVLMVSMLGTAFSFLMLALTRTFWWILIARALDGVAGSNLATAQAYIADMSPPEQRTRNLGMWIGAAFGLGFAFGPFFGGAFHWIGLHWLPSHAIAFPFLAASALAFINVAFAYFKLPESLHVKTDTHAIGKRTSSWNIIRTALSSNLGPLMLTYAIIILAFAQMEGTFSWLSKDLYHFTPTEVYAVFGYLGFVMALVQGGVVRKLAPILGDKTLTLLGCGLMIVGLIGLPLFHQWAYLLLMSGLLAIGESFANPALISSISQGASDTVQGETMGVTQSLASLSRFLGPLLAGFLYQQYGLIAPYWLAAALILLSAFLCRSAFTNIAKPLTVAS